MKSPKASSVTVALTLLLIAGWLLWSSATTAEQTPYTRGATLAEAHGCLACHSGALTGAMEVPPLQGCELPVEEFQSWVLYGGPQAQIGQAPQSGFGMPAYEGRLNPQDLQDLLAWSQIAGHETPTQGVLSELARAEQVAHKAGCFDCHGPLGQGGIKNTGSFTGAIPGFSGEQFKHLCDDSDPAAIEEWIRHGASERFLSGDPLAGLGRSFMSRQLTKMPAYQGVLSDEEIALLVQYCLHINSLGPMSAERYLTHREALASPQEEVKGQGEPQAAPGLPDEVAELFSSKCIRCHGPKKQKSGYRMDTAGGAFQPGDIAAFLEVSVIQPDAPEESLLYQFVSATEEDSLNEVFPMPPSEDERLSPKDLKAVRDWIAAGAPWADEQTLQSTYSD